MNPQKCSNCRTEKKKCTILTILVDSGIIIEEEVHGMDWSCPMCHGKFCNACFAPDYDGNGSTFFCPHCKGKLAFPKVFGWSPLPPSNST